MFSRRIGFTLLLMALSGCSYLYGETGVIKNRDSDYLQATSIAPLRIPPGLSSASLQAECPVSNTQYPTGQVKPSLMPPDL